MACGNHRRVIRARRHAHVPDRCDCVARFIEARHIGLTLVELVVALFLASLLMVGLLGVLKGIERQRQIVEQVPDELWQIRVQELLERDLRAASSVGWSAGRLTLEGTLPSYELGSPSTERSVEYGISDFGEGDSLLYRRDRGELQWIAIGPRRLVAERIDPLGMPQPLPVRPGPVPQRMHVWLWNELEGPPILHFDVMP